MTMHFFAIPALESGAEHGSFAAFCCAHRVVQVDREFVADARDHGVKVAS